MSGLEITQAEKKRRNAYRMSQVNGWNIAGFGVLSLIVVSFWFNVAGLMVSLSLLVFGLMEVSGGRALRDGRPGAVGRLCASQGLLMLSLEVYCLVQLLSFDGAHPEAILSERVQVLLHQLVMDSYMEAWMVKTSFMLVYLCMMFVILFYQGGMYFYYRSRRKYRDLG